MTRRRPPPSSTGASILVDSRASMGPDGRALHASARGACRREAFLCFFSGGGFFDEKACSRREKMKEGPTRVCRARTPSSPRPLPARGRDHRARSLILVLPPPPFDPIPPTHVPSQRSVIARTEADLRAKAEELSEVIMQGERAAQLEYRMERLDAYAAGPAPSGKSGGAYAAAASRSHAFGSTKPTQKDRFNSSVGDDLARDGRAVASMMTRPSERAAREYLEVGRRGRKLPSMGCHSRTSRRVARLPPLTSPGRGIRTRTPRGDEKAKAARAS